MLVLGLSAFYRDSAGALLRDGEIVAAVQEERFTRKKHDPSFPANAIAYCLKEARVDGRAILPSRHAALLRFAKPCRCGLGRSSSSVICSCANSRPSIQRSAIKRNCAFANIIFRMRPRTIHSTPRCTGLTMTDHRFEAIFGGPAPRR
jgi:predicted NodU family carbamoyl transferase